MKRLLSIALILAAGVAPALAQKTYTANYTSGAITIDGVANEAAWAAAAAGGGDFVDHSTGAASTQQTTFKVLWDTANLYITMSTNSPSPSFDANLDTNDDTFTFTKDDFELFLDPISSRNSEPNPSHKYQMTFYPNTDGTGAVINAPTGFVWTGAGATEFPGGGTWANTSGIQVAVVVAAPTVVCEVKIPWQAFDVTTVNTQAFSLPPANGDIWSAQPCRHHAATNANNFADTKWNPSAAGFRTKPWGLWTFTGRPASSAASDWQNLQ